MGHQYLRARKGFLSYGILDQAVYFCLPLGNTDFNRKYCGQQG